MNYAMMRHLVDFLCVCFRCWCGSEVPSRSMTGTGSALGGEEASSAGASAGAAGGGAAADVNESKQRSRGREEN